MMVNIENRNVIGKDIDEVVDRYTFLVKEVDGAYKVTVIEWDLTVRRVEAQTALDHAQQKVEDRLEQMDREDWPEPLSEREYSGQFTVRIPKSLHRELTEEAEELRISLNELVKRKLSD